MALEFVPELASLRNTSSYVNRTNVNSTSTQALFSGLQVEIKATFAVAQGAAGSPSGLVVHAPSDFPSPNASIDCVTNPFKPCYGWDRGGADLGCTSPPGTVAQCEATCLAKEACMAWTWCGNGSAGPEPRCCLKSFVPNEVQPFANMACGIAPRAKGHIPAGAMDFNHSGRPTGGTVCRIKTRIFCLSFDHQMFAYAYAKVALP
jgi:hypothetical protein